MPCIATFPTTLESHSHFPGVSCTFIFETNGPLRPAALEYFPSRRSFLRTFRPPRTCVEIVLLEAGQTYLHAKLEKLDRLILRKLVIPGLH